jgi:hypothetical protein
MRLFGPTSRVSCGFKVSSTVDVGEAPTSCAGPGCSACSFRAFNLLWQLYLQLKSRLPLAPAPSYASCCCCRLHTNVHHRTRQLPIASAIYTSERCCSCALPATPPSLPSHHPPSLPSHPPIPSTPPPTPTHPPTHPPTTLPSHPPTTLPSHHHHRLSLRLVVSALFTQHWGVVFSAMTAKCA